MRIFTYWIEHTAELEVQGKKQLSKAFGGSNISLDEARKDAIRKLEKAQGIIQGTAQKVREYEADIREEIIETIDSDNIITRNRYGALILNTKHLMFIDIDVRGRSLFDKLFQRGKSAKEIALSRIIKTANKEAYAGLGFRIYETFQGYRVMVTNEDFSAQSMRSRNILQDFGADEMYRYLCERQNCYRARLSPKPYRVKQKGIKVKYPHRTAEQEAELAQWLKSYAYKSQRFVSCRFIQQIGTVRDKQKIIAYHDHMTKTRSDDPLA